MGYGMSQVCAKFTILCARKQEALKALKKMDPNTKGKGFVLGKKEWAWVDQTTVNEAETLEEALEEWAFEASINEEGDIIDLTFISEKLGQEPEMFKVLAPFVESGSYIQMIGEDHSEWCWTFNNGTFKEE